MLRTGRELRGHHGIRTQFRIGLDQTLHHVSEGNRLGVWREARSFDTEDIGIASGPHYMPAGLVATLRQLSKSAQSVGQLHLSRRAAFGLEEPWAGN